MSHKHIEYFAIPELGMYSISENEHPHPTSRTHVILSYTPWLNGHAIHPYFNTLEEARKHIFECIVNEVNIRLKIVNARLELLNGIKSTLGVNVENISEYKEVDS